jgi:hypothetical protein
MDKYAQWQRSVLPVLSKLARTTEARRWNPDQVGARALSTADKSYRPDKDLPSQIPQDRFANCYIISGTDTKWAPRRDRNDKGVSLIIFDRQGSSKIVILGLDPELRGMLRAIALAIPVIELSLKDADGLELDGQEHNVFFEENSAIGHRQTVCATSFWSLGGSYGYAEGDGMASILGRPMGGRGDELGWSAYAANDPVIVFPYMAIGSIACPVFTREFPFTLTLDQLAKLKSVEARISSRDNAGEAEER